MTGCLTSLALRARSQTPRVEGGKADLELDGEPERVDDEVNLRCGTSARAPDRLRFGPPFRPEAC